MTSRLCERMFKPLSLLLASLIIGPAAASATAIHSSPARVQAVLGAGTADLHVELLPRTDDASKHIEIFWTQPTGIGPWPLVVFLHGHQDGSSTPGGKAFLDYGVLEDAATRGYIGVGVSQPGYGRSEGPADFMGTFTQRAV